MTPREKAFAAAAIIAAWGGLVAIGLSPVDQFVQVLRDALIGLGVFSAAMANPKN